jgi:hypothetical protein
MHSHYLSYTPKHRWHLYLEDPFTISENIIFIYIHVI